MWRGQGSRGWGARIQVGVWIGEGGGGWGKDSWKGKWGVEGGDGMIVGSRFVAGYVWGSGVERLAGGGAGRCGGHLKMTNGSQFCLRAHTESTRISVPCTS